MEEEPVDSTAWILDNSLAEFLIMHTTEIKYMCMFGYTFMHGSKVFGSISSDAPLSYKFVSMILACTGGGIMVPIFINSIPVPLTTDAYPIAIFASFLLHQYFPLLREVLKVSYVLKAAVIFLYETLRASVVVKLTAAAAAAIPPSEFSIPIFGPIFCGTIAGCGGAFLPLNKGLDPIKNGLAPNMMSAMFGGLFYHVFVNTSLSDGVKNAPKKAHAIVSFMFILFGIIQAFNLRIPGIYSTTTAKPKPKPATKKD
uniref:Uncharacterized protein n=1 Tax=Grammatophora oceanica TaxID=210454 RepID=A0A7S1V1V1_9STRA